MPAHRPQPIALQEDRLVAVLRCPGDTDLSGIVEILFTSGVRTIELTLTSPNALSSLIHLKDQFGPSAVFGIGTITSLTQAQESLAAGADFLVTPTHVDGVVALGSEAGIPTFPGALTPTEISRAWEEGATAVKVFPASLVGPQYLRELGGPFPDIAFMPSGGVSISAIPDWLEQGAVAVSLGGALLGDALAGDLEGLRIRTKAARDHVRRWVDST